MTTSSSRLNLITPSNVPLTSQNLAEVREMKFREGHRLRDEPIPDVDESWMEFVRLFQGPTARQTTDLEEIKKVMRNDYELDSQFNIALFLALRKSLEKQKLIFPIPRNRWGKKKEDFPIVFRYGVEGRDTRSWPKFAIGIQREANGELNNQEDKGDSSSGSRSGLALRAKMDHSTCLLARQSSTTPWKEAACLSAVELKISGAKNFATLNISNDIAQEFAFNDNPGGATQVMMYTMGWVLSSLGKIGQIDDEGIPWSVILGKKKIESSNASQLRTRAISGKIYVPEACGDRFEWNVTGYVRSDGNDVDEAIISRAISIYFGSLFFGLNAAKTWMDAPKPVTPHQTSGQKVMIGRQELVNLSLRGSAAFGKFRSSPPNQDTRWGISQGEIFTGKVNIFQINEGLSKREKSDFAVFKAENEHVDVVVKVSSLAVHGYLVHHKDSFPALKEVLASDVDLSDVLYAVYHMPMGMVTFMADLSIEGFHDLKPSESKAPLAMLWTGLKGLVHNVLLPLAEIGYIHPDIRPGFDITANILCRIEESGAATMQLIDYESIIRSKMWLPPSSSDSKYITVESKWTCETFVWWQCFSIAYAWIERKNQVDMISVKPKDSLLSQAKTRGTWLEAFLGAAAKEGLNPAKDEMDPSDVTKFVDLLEVEICKAELRRAEVLRQEPIRQREETRRGERARREEDARHQGGILENERHRNQEADRASRFEARQTQAEARQMALESASGTSGGKRKRRRRRS